MKIAWLPVAARNRTNQIAYMADRNPRAAIDLGDAIEATIKHLMDHPKIGRPGRVRGTRELVVGGTPFLIIYRVEPDRAVILRLLHGAQRWPDIVRSERPNDADP